MTNEKQMIGVVQEWRRNPLRFVMEAIGVRPTNQQANALVILGKLYEAKIKRALGQPLTDEEKMLSNKLGITIRSGHGTGKDAWLAWVYLWLLVCFPGARGLVTAPTQHQLQDVLWSEIRKWSRKSAGRLSDYVEVASEKAYRRDRGAKDDSFIVNRTARITANQDEQAETLQGLHGEYMILSVDEASGVADGVFRPLEGTMTGLFNIAILISNPTRNTGYFFHSHHSDRRNWVALHWSCEESDMDAITGIGSMASYCERMKAKHGAESNFYRMRVQGEFPMAEPDALISLDLILPAIGREVVEDPRQGLVLGVDVAWMGTDMSVICPRRGMIVEPLYAFPHQTELMTVAHHVAQEMAERNPKMIVIDSSGIGAGVVSRLREMNKSVTALNVSESAPHKDRFSRLRDELWWKLRERFESRMISIPNDDELIGELAGMKFKVELNGKIKIESKADMRKRGLPSPNRADALMMTEYFPDSVFREQVPDRYDMFRDTGRKTGWMGA